MADAAMLDRIFIARGSRSGSWRWRRPSPSSRPGPASYAQSVLMTMVGQRVIADVQTSLFARRCAPISPSSRQLDGSLISRFTNDAGMLRGAATNILAGIGKDALTVVFSRHPDVLSGLGARSRFLHRLPDRLPSASASAQDAAGFGEYAGRARPFDVARPDLQGARHVSLWLEDYEARRAERRSAASSR
jgi:subfamily B ATP-binding cassette protein MsbA